MPQLELINTTNLPPFHKIPSYKFQNIDYYRINDVINSYFIKKPNQSPAKILGTTFWGRSHVVPSKEAGKEIGMVIDRGSETIIDLAAVFYLIMNVTSGNKETQHIIFNHIISTVNPPINNNGSHLETSSELGFCDSYFGLEEFFDDEEDEEVESDSNSSNKTHPIQQNDSINQENHMIDEGIVPPNFLEQTTLNSQQTDEFLPEHVVEQVNIVKSPNNLINNFQYDSYSSAISQITEIINDTQNQSQLHQLRNPFPNIYNNYSYNFENSQHYNAHNLSQYNELMFSQTPINYTQTSSSVPVDQIIEKEIEKVIINGFSCSHCNNSASVYFSGKYSGIDNCDCFSKQAKHRCKMDLECFEKLLKAQNHDLYLWFECLLTTREGRKKVFDILTDADNERVKVLFKERKQTRNVDDVLYWKDNNLVSFKIVNNLRKECYLSEEIPPTNDMKKRKQSIDEEVEKIFKIIAPSNGIVGFITDLHVSVEHILKLYRCLGGKHLPKTIYFKLCVDGREINGKKQIAIALVPLNLRDIFPTQAVSSVFYIGLFLGSETKSSLPETVGSLSESLKSISSKQFENSNIRIIYVSDMLNIGATFQFDVCPFCNATRVLQYNAELKHSISGIIPFQLDEIYLCVLHIKQRLIENTIAYCASHGRNQQIILDNLRNLPGMELFDWRELKTRVSIYGNPTTENRSTVKCSMITGDRCDMILENYPVIFESISEESKSQYLYLFSLLKDIIKILEMKQDSPNESEKLQESHIKHLQKLIIEFLIQSVNLWTFSINSHYYHYIIHVPDMMRRLLKMELSLSAISNQGFERSHLFHHAVFNRALSNGGGKKKLHPTKQLLLWQWRKVHLAIALHSRTGSTYWEDKRMKVEYVWSKTKERLANQQQFKLVNQKIAEKSCQDLTLLIDNADKLRQIPTNDDSNSEPTPLITPDSNLEPSTLINQTPTKSTKKARSTRSTKSTKSTKQTKPTNQTSNKRSRGLFEKLPKISK